ncbi:hypothetical protein GIB67_011028 [Kingdonia uniflora]|uniref:Amino acid transporter transmembrane domain-containing protein n=1 Tax=Kingdonia uniflora TaxID=39325 RepID=A0A7J7L6L1_9MAGN|nr:hypothetical protein GIB67_011028 [Kingdonia uniflora]
MLSAKENKIFKNVLRLFPKKAAANEYNLARLVKTRRPVARLPSVDNCATASSASFDDAKGLEKKLYIYVGALVMLRSNLATRYGLVNGAVGTVVDSVYSSSPKPPNDLPLAVMADFNNFSGKSFREDTNIIPIPPQTVNWKTFSAETWTVLNISKRETDSLMDTLKSTPAENRTMKKASIIAISVTTFFYICCGCIVYAAIPGNLFAGFGFYEPFWLLDFANACIVVFLVGGYQVISQPMFAFMEGWLAEKFLYNGFINKFYTIKIPLYLPWTFNQLLATTVKQELKVHFCKSSYNLSGFEVTTDACCGFGPYKGRVMCISPELACRNASNHLWWDQFRPTDAVNSILMDNAWSSLHMKMCYPTN